METQTENATENAEIGEDNKEVAEKEEDDLDLESFGKKKKKKKKVVEFDGEEKGAEDAGEKEVAGEGTLLLHHNAFYFFTLFYIQMENPILEINVFFIIILDDIDLESFGKKKKKKKNRDTMDMDDLEEALPDEDGVSKFEVYIFSDKRNHNNWRRI